LVCGAEIKVNYEQLDFTTDVKKMQSRICCFLLTLLVSSYSNAIEMADLYIAEVPVESQNPMDLAEGARRGMKSVLVRVSGNSNIAQNPLIKRELRRPQNYYYQYSYLRNDLSESLPNDAGQRLQVHFEPNAIARLLRDAGFPVWGSNRPSTLVWLAVENQGGRSLLSDQSSDEVIELLSSESKRWGLPVLFPILDLEDTANITTAAVWGGFQRRVDVASARYDADAILSGRIYQGADGEWSGYWFYKVDGDWISHENLSIHMRDVVADIIGRLAESLAQKYAIDSTRGQILLRVDAVENLSDYVLLSNYLQNLAPVLDVGVEQVNGKEILYSLQTEGKIEQLVELINLDEKLTFTGRPGETGGRVLDYRWMP
jgi:hypothetical protein